MGTLIIDEAGQATPYSALGVLWRAKKAIIVGDPLHVEPVVTVPKELSRRFADEFERLRFQKITAFRVYLSSAPLDLWSET